MDWIVLAAAGMAVFVMRDVVCAGWRWNWVGMLLHVMAAVGLGVMAESVSRDMAQGLLREVLIWGTAVGVHGVAALVMWWKGWWWVMSLPGPMYLFSAGGTAWLLLNSVSGLAGWKAGAAVGLGYVVVVLLLGWVMRRMGGVGLRRVVEFGAAANLSAILLVPMQQGAEGGVGEMGLDWKGTLIAAVLTVGMVGVSYAWSRQRSGARAWRSE